MSYGPSQIVEITMADFIVREAHPDEYDQVGDVLEDAFTHGCWITEEYRQGLHTIAERAKSSRVWVAENPEHELVAAVLTPRKLSNGVATFNILGVAAKGRGHGLGHRLVEHAVAEAEAQGADCIAINSSPHMTFAHQLYYQHGFVRRPERETAVVDSGQRLYAFSRWIQEPKATTPKEKSVSTFATNALADDIHDLAQTIAGQHNVDSGDRQVGAQINRDLIEPLDQIAAQQTEALIRLFYARLGYYDYQLGTTNGFLEGPEPTRNDAQLFALLVLFDLRLRQHFGWGAASIRDYPDLWSYALRLADEQGFLTEELKERIGLVRDPYETTPTSPNLTTGLGHNDLVAAWSTPVKA